MKIKMNYLAQVRKTTQLSSEIIELSEPYTVQRVIKKVLCEKYVSLKTLILEESGEIKPIILVFCGDVKVEDSIPLPLKDGDVITIMPPITGG